MTVDYLDFYDRYRTMLKEAIDNDDLYRMSNIRCALKRDLLQIISRNETDIRIIYIRDVLADGFEHLRLSKQIRFDMHTLSTCAMQLLIDAETAGMQALDTGLAKSGLHEPLKKGL